MFSLAVVIVISYVRDERFDKTLENYSRSKLVKQNIISAEYIQNIPGDNENISQYCITGELQLANRIDQHLLMENILSTQLISQRHNNNLHQTTSTVGLRVSADQITN